MIRAKPDALVALLLVALLLPYPFTDLRPKEAGWTVRDVGPEAPATIDYAKLESVVFHEEEEKSWVVGTEMLRRAREDAQFVDCNHGQHLGEALLKNRVALTAALLPKEGEVFILPGTVLVDGNRNLHVPYLVFIGGAWKLRWFCLGYGFDRYCRFIRFRN